MYQPAVLKHLLFATMLGGSVVTHGAGTPQTHTAGDVSFVSGGVGNASQRTMQEIADRFNLRLSFADDAGRYLANVPVIIEDASGETLVDTVSAGPLFYVDLDAGMYTVSATANGVTHRRQIDIADNGAQDVTLSW